MHSPEASSNNHTNNATSEQIYYRGKYCIIIYEPRTHIGIIEWLDYNPSNLFREASEKLIEMVAEKGVKKIVNNTEQLKIIAGIASISQF